MLELSRALRLFSVHCNVKVYCALELSRKEKNTKKHEKKKKRRKEKKRISKETRKEKRKSERKVRRMEGVIRQLVVVVCIV